MTMAQTLIVLAHNFHASNILQALEECIQTSVEEILTLEYDEDYGRAVEKRIWDRVTWYSVHSHFSIKSHLPASFLLYSIHNHI
ncbi:hypothetical protein N7465_001198 [Penicillium sp. CMV-2018d]|nr:hypothetical protein N7465_001198 [Penicillium sp. CMV-2018d]